jgi:hypothetical protein
MATIYAGAGDAYLRSYATSVWADHRDAGTADIVNATATRNNIAVRIKIANGNYYVYRSFFAFDTSGVSIAPDSATLKLYGYSNDAADVIIVKVAADATGDSGTAFVASDFGKIDGAPDFTAYSSEISTWSTSGYNDITLNAAALSDMASLDEFKLALIEYDHDFSDSAPTSGVINTGVYFADYEGTSYDPYIDYVEGTATTAFSTTQHNPTGSIMDNDYTINNHSIDVLSPQHDRNTKQVPFILGTRSTINLRGRRSLTTVAGPESLLGDTNANSVAVEPGGKKN